MAYPYIFSENFDQGGRGNFDSETDVSGALDFPHYTALAAVPGSPMPYRGAYCMRIAAPGNTADHILTEGDIDISAGATGWVRFALYISKDFAASADDIFNIFEFKASSTIETAIALQVIAATDLVGIGIGETTAASFPANVSKGQWHTVECGLTVDAGTNNDGTATLYLDGHSIQTISSVDQGAITNGVLGTQLTLTTTDEGYILFDEFAFDDTRLGITHRYASSRLITNSAFMFVGPGRIDNVKLLDGGSGDVTLELYDTDVYNASLTPVWRDRTIVNSTNVSPADVPISFSRGCLALLGGTLPGAVIGIGRAVGWGSDGAIRSYASNRKAAVGGL